MSPTALIVTDEAAAGVVVGATIDGTAVSVVGGAVADAGSSSTEHAARATAKTQARALAIHFDVRDRVRGAVALTRGAP
jgi:hypothetical protein